MKEAICSEYYTASINLKAYIYTASLVTLLKHVLLTVRSAVRPNYEIKLVM